MFVLFAFMASVQAGGAAVQTSTAPVQSAAADEAVLVVKLKGVEVGRETVKVRPARPGRATGDSLVLAASYPATRPTSEYRAVLERSPAGSEALEINVIAAEGATQIYAAAGRARVTVRTVARGTESAREFPSGEHVVLLDENLLGLFLSVAREATDAGARLTAIFPRTARRVTFTARRAAGRLTVDEVQTTEIQLSGGITGSINLDDAGRLFRVALPELGVEATRLH